MIARRHFLTATAALAATSALLGRARAEAGGPRLLVYWVDGGWDPTYVFDPHFGSSVVAGDTTAAAAQVGDLAFADAPTRPSVRAFFERWGGRTAVINGVAIGSISHDTCTRIVLTGQRGDAPDVPTRIAHATGSALAAPHVVLEGPRFPGDLGSVVTTFNRTFAETAAGRLPSTRDAAREARIQAWLAEEVAAMPIGTRTAEYRDGLARLAPLQAYAVETNLSSETVEADRVRIAADLFSRDLARTVLLEGERVNLSNWDSHVDNAYNQDRCFENLFGRLVTLMETLEATPGSGGGSLADEVVVAVLSEMGRHPVLNAANGKDHWPYTSAMLVGRGVSGGRTYGATGDDLVGRPCDPSTGEPSEHGEVLTAAHLCATLLAGFDVDPADAGLEVAPLDILAAT